VNLLYLGYPPDPNATIEPPPEPEPAAKGKKGAKEEPVLPAAAMIKMSSQHEDILLKDGWWRPDTTHGVRLPTFSSPGADSEEAASKPEDSSPEAGDAGDETEVVAPVVDQVFVRGYTRSSATGLCQVPVPCNAEGPPLVFIRSAVTGTSFRDGRSCEVVKARPRESIYFDVPAPEPAPAPVVEAAPAKGKKGAPVEEEAPPPAPPPPPLVLKSAGDLGYQSFFFFRAPATEMSCEESEIQMRLDTYARIKVVVAFLETPQPPSPDAISGDMNEGSKESLEDEASTSKSPVPPREPPPLPSWVKKEGWKRYEPRLPVSLIAYGDQPVTADRFATKEFDNGIVTIRGSGPELTCLVFFVQHGATRPNVLKNLLLDEPNLLGAERALALFTRRVRSELGDAVARRTVMDRRAEWAPLLQTAPEKEVQAWIYERKIEAFEKILLDPDTWEAATAHGLPGAGQGRRLSVSVMKARSLETSAFTGYGSWCYCSVKRPKGSNTDRPSFKTRKLDNVSPEWYETHELSPWQPGEALEFTICDNGFCAEFLGTPVDCTNQCRAEIASERFYPDCFDSELPVASVAQLQKLRVSMIQLKNAGFCSEKNLYVVCKVPHTQKSAKPTTCQTMTTTGSTTPSWQGKDNTHEIDSWKPGEPLEFNIFNQVKLGSQFVCRGALPSDRFWPNGFEGDVPVECEGKPQGMLHVCILPAGVKNTGIPGAGMPKLRLRIQVIENARTMVAQCSDLANITAPALANSCKALKKGLGGTPAALQVASRWPRALATEPKIFLHALAVLSNVFGEGRAQGWATQFPYLLSRGKQIETVFDRCKELYPLIYVERLCTRTDGEWALWRAMVDEHTDAVTRWLGRIAAEERSLTCEDRVRAFGKS
jgi:hypothetical protein